MGVPERELLDQAESVLHSLALRLLSNSPRLKEPYTDMPEQSPWSMTFGPLASRAHELARAIRQHLGLPHRWATRALGTPPLEIEDVIAEAVAAAPARIAQLEALAAGILASYHKGSDGYRGRVGQMQIAKWQAELDGSNG